MSETYSEIKERLEIKHCGDMLLEGAPSSWEAYLLYYIAELEQELDTERVRLAACGVVASANTRESAKKAREMNPEYFNGMTGVMLTSWRRFDTPDTTTTVTDEIASRDVLAERERQKGLGWTPEHDDSHGDEQIADTAVFLAIPHTCAGLHSPGDPITDGFDHGWCNHKDRRTDLVRAAALLIAEIERLDRTATGEGE